MSDNPYASPQTEIQTGVATEAALGKRPLATRGQRFAGHLIDFVILIVGAMVGTGVVVGVVLSLSPAYLDGPETQTQSIIVSGVVLLIMSLVFLAVNGYLLATRGQTVGKLVVKTQIVSDQDELVPLSKIFLARYLLFWCLGMIPVVGRFLSIVDSVMIFRESHKCWHDEMAGTKVVMLKTPAHHRQLPDEVKIPQSFE